MFSKYPSSLPNFIVKDAILSLTAKKYLVRSQVLPPLTILIETNHSLHGDHTWLPFFLSHTIVMINTYFF